MIIFTKSLTLAPKLNGIPQGIGCHEVRLRGVSHQWRSGSTLCVCGLVFLGLLHSGRLSLFSSCGTHSVMTITTTTALGQKKAKQGSSERMPIIEKQNPPFTLTQLKQAIPPHCFKHSLPVCTSTIKFSAASIDHQRNNNFSNLFLKS